MKKIFYIIRHGQTELNARRIWQGCGMDYPLNVLGWQQADAAAEKLKDKKLDIICCSNLQRAFETAITIAKPLRLTVLVNGDFRESNAGQAEGKHISYVMEHFGEIVHPFSYPHQDNLNVCFPGGETLAEVQARVKRGFEFLLKVPANVMGVVTHAGVMSVILSYLGYEDVTIKNCEVFKVIYENGIWSTDGILF